MVVEPSPQATRAPRRSIALTNGLQSSQTIATPQGLRESTLIFVDGHLYIRRYYLAEGQRRYSIVFFFLSV